MIEPDYESFEKSRFTAICSDLHLCENEPPNEKFPLWKKYKTSEYFFDKVFADFLVNLEKLSKGEPIELILNGDIFDFDSVLSLPQSPTFRINWLEQIRGMRPRPEKSTFKIKKILDHHKVWVDSLREFIYKENRVIFVIGNHDLELHFEEVQKAILDLIAPTEVLKKKVRFTEWFYISNKDTLVEHGNQYDPYCLCEDPINPYVLRYNHKEIKLPFGNIACRYILNGLGFFNPHVDKNYIMGVKEYISFFIKYMLKAQPFLIWTWFWGSVVTLYYTFIDRFAERLKDPLHIEDKVNNIAIRANAEPRMVRELRELFATPANSSPVLLARELWLDRAFLILIAFFGIFILFLFIKQIYNISFFWAFIPLFLFLPFFLFYSKSVQSLVSNYKEPNEKILHVSSLITKTQRVVYGHTHIARHEVIGAVEHLNSGSWSPAFMDVECTKPIDQKTFIWIYPQKDSEFRVADLMQLKDGVMKVVSK
jgi:UDP-2,3-diacylglucosamine pyrophosphatase LpxH